MGLAALKPMSGAIKLPEGLTCRAQFLQVQRRGRRQHGRLLTLLSLAGRPLGLCVGITVSRKVGNAVVRNRVKRRLREAVRHHHAIWQEGAWHVLVAHPAAADASFAALRDEVASLLCRHQRRALMGGAPKPLDTPVT